MNNSLEEKLVQLAIDEDLGDGDITSLACIPASSTCQSRLLVKENGIIAGIRVARKVFSMIDPNISVKPFIEDGQPVRPGDIVFIASGSTRLILQAERLVLNFMQRMSGIATLTKRYVEMLDGLKTRIMDTRKTTPGFRLFEKEAVRIGGALNHRMGLYDMVLIKDNHIDKAGGIKEAILQTLGYDPVKDGKAQIEIEARTLDDVHTIIEVGGIHRVLLDNFNLDDTRTAVERIDGRFETESSGGIHLDNVRDYALCGVDFISVGALTHQIHSLDLSLKIVL